MTEDRNRPTMTGVITDEEIMMQVSNGELRKLTILFDKYKDRLYSFFYRLTRGDGSLSNDLSQNVFEKIIKHRGTYKLDFPFKGWMFQIARNVHIDHHRKQKMKYSDGVDLAKLPLYAELSDEKLEKKERHKMLHKVIDQLKPEHREVILLTRFENLKYAEVAHIQGVTESAVKVRVHRAIKEMKDMYQNIEL